MQRLSKAVAAAVVLLWAPATLAQTPTPTPPAPAPQAQPSPPPAAQPTTLPPAAPRTGVSYGQPVGPQPTSGQPVTSAPPTGYTPYQPASVYRQPSHPDLPGRPAGDRVSGDRGSLSITDSACSTAGVLPNTRRRLVALAAGEWAAFGFPTLDVTARDTLVPSGPDFQIVDPALNPVVQSRVYQRLMRLGSMEDDRIAVTAVGGYWTSTPGAYQTISQQNSVWSASGNSAGWALPWSAAFISWVACEGGLGDPAVFRRSASHWNYIDQAIEARNGSAPSAAYHAYDIGEAAISPGDMLCFSNDATPYRSIAERRAQLGRGFPSHCDIVVRLDPARERIFLIGGNVAQSVTMTIARAARRSPGGPLVPFNDLAMPGSRRWFAHLRLQAPLVSDSVMDETLPMRNLRVLAASQGLLNPSYPALNNPASVPGVAPPPSGYPTPAPQPVAPAAPTTPPVTSQPVPNPPAGPVTSTPVPNPAGR